LKIHPPVRLSREAFTLTELLIVMGILALLGSLGVAAFKGGTASDGSRGASYAAATLFDAARNEAIMRKTPTRVIFDTVFNPQVPDNYLRRMTVAYASNSVDSNGIPTGQTNWMQAGQWVKLPAAAYFDNAVGPNGKSRSTPSDSAMTIPQGGLGAKSGGATYWAYQYFPNGQADYSSNPPVLKVVFSPGSVIGGTFQERPDRKSLYGFIIGKLGHTQQFADLQSLTNCP
jgi:prepilin-type N-terminal cleavage/methylation domain-containing protein